MPNREKVLEINMMRKASWMEEEKKTMDAADEWKLVATRINFFMALCFIVITAIYCFVSLMRFWASN